METDQRARFKKLPKPSSFRAHAKDQLVSVVQGQKLVIEQYGASPYYRICQFFYGGGCMVYYASTYRAAFKLLGSCVSGKRRSNGTYMNFVVASDGSILTWETMSNVIKGEKK